MRLIRPTTPIQPLSTRPFGNLLVIGHARHGKDTAAELLAGHLGLSLKSSSLFMCEKVIHPMLQAWAAGDKSSWAIRNFMDVRDNQPPPLYETAEECFNDRHNYRALWFNIIRQVNNPDAATLGRMIWAEHDIYVGLRSKAEFHALRNSGLINLTIWVDRSDWLPNEDPSSMQLEPWMADRVIDNNGTLDQLKFNVKQLADALI